MGFEERIPYMIELGFSEAAVVKLRSFFELLWSANEELNLFSRQMTKDELVDNHFIDCLLPLKQFPADAKAVADFGSGGGLPAIIYALHFANIRFYLFEKSPKKQGFLKKCAEIAPNIEVKGEIPRNLVGIDLVTARGFKPIDVILEVSRSYYDSGGKYFLLKARLEKINEELVLAKKKFKELKVTVVPLKSPVLEVERHLVLI